VAFRSLRIDEAVTSVYSPPMPAHLPEVRTSLIGKVPRRCGANRSMRFTRNTDSGADRHATMVRLVLATHKEKEVRTFRTMPSTGFVLVVALAVAMLGSAAAKNGGIRRGFHRSGVAKRSIVRSSDAKTDIIRQYAAIDKATATGNVQGVLDHVTDDFTLMPHGGKRITRRQTELALNQTLRQIPRKSVVKTTVTSFTLKRNRAIVENTGTVTTNGPEHRLVVKSVCRDTWIPTKSGWRMKEQAELSQTVTMDGKVVDLSAPRPAPRKKR
jgi:hypothetical protein